MAAAECCNAVLLSTRHRRLQAVPVIFSKTNISSKLSASTVAPKKETSGRNKSHHELAQNPGKHHGFLSWSLPWGLFLQFPVACTGTIPIPTLKFQVWDALTSQELAAHSLVLGLGRRKRKPKGVLALPAAGVVGRRAQINLQDSRVSPVLFIQSCKFSSNFTLPKFWRFNSDLCTITFSPKYFTSTSSLFRVFLNHVFPGKRTTFTMPLVGIEGLEPVKRTRSASSNSLLRHLPW